MRNSAAGDDAGSVKVEEVTGKEYEPWFTPVLEQIIGGELPGEVESLFFCIQTGLGVGVLAFGFGYLVARKKIRRNAAGEAFRSGGNSVIAGILAGLVFFSLFAGQLPPVWLAAVCLGVVLFFLLAGGHHHDGVLTMDVYARRSRLCRENAAFKTGVSFLLLILCICCQSPIPPLCLFVFLPAVTVAAGGIKLRTYLSLLTLPGVFLLLSGLTLLWDYTSKLPEEAVLSLPFFGGWLAVLPATQSLAMLVLSRALGAVSCLYFLSLSTPLPELLAVLRRVHVPAIMVELAVLIYRYIFILLSTFRK